MDILSDNPVSTAEQDTLGFEPYAQILASAIRDSDDLPLCVGIF